MPLADPATAPRPVLFLIGAPGTGKTTQGARLAPALGGLHLSAGDLVRQARAEDEASGLDRSKQMRRPDWIVGQLTTYAAGAPLLVVDGFPRMPEHVALAQSLGEVAGVIRLKVDFQTALDRMCDRARAGEGAAQVLHRRTFHAKHEPAVLAALDACGIPRVDVDGRGSLEEVAGQVMHAARQMLRGTRPRPGPVQRP